MANWPNITHQNENDPTDEVVIRHQGINYLQKREVFAASISNARWTSEGNYEVGSEVQGSDGQWYIAVIANGSSIGNAVNPVTKTDNSIWKMSPRIGEVTPLNNNWNGYLDPDHTTPIQKEDTSAGTRAFVADTEIAPNLFVSGTGDVTFSTTGMSWLAGNSLYRLYPYNAEQLATIDIDTISVYLKDQNGSEYFVNNSTTGVNVTKPDATTLKVEITDAIFADLGITKLWRWFDTETIGRVVELSTEALIDKIYPELLNARELTDVTASRALGVTYTNTSATEIDVYISATSPTSFTFLLGLIGGETIVGTSAAGANKASLYMRVPAGQDYRCSPQTGTFTTLEWKEMRLP